MASIKQFDLCRIPPRKAYPEHNRLYSCFVRHLALLIWLIKMVHFHAPFLAMA
ncbi:MAG: hypothetical protein IKX33_08365 [Prevotella sp.]|nr:hypothetical protein [Prevotella sp.]